MPNSDREHTSYQPQQASSTTRLPVCGSICMSFSIHCMFTFSTLALCLQVDPDKAFAVQIKHEESVLTGNVAYMQCAVLFSSSNGERRIRYPTTASAHDCP